MQPTEQLDKIIHTRFVRLFLEHRAEARLSDLTEAEIVERTGAIFLALMGVVIAAEREGNRATLDKLTWFTRACADEIDGTPRARLDD